MTHLIRLDGRKTPCGEGQILHGGDKTLLCTREAGHLGQHQDFSRADMYFTFDEGGSSGSWYKSAFANGWGPAYVCSLCGVVDVWHWHGQKPSDGTCFSCNLWTRRAAAFDPVQQVVIDGRLYSLGKHNGHAPRAGMGFGGHRFRIETFAGDVIEHNDVWSGGAVPSHFRDRLPDTARFAEAQVTP